MSNATILPEIDTQTPTDLWRMSALQLAEAIRSGQASSREVIEAHLRRIEDVNPSVNAVTVVLGERALEEHHFRRVGLAADRQRCEAECRALVGGTAGDSERPVGVSRMPECCLVNWYTEGARMGLHQDRDEADFAMPVLSVSLGMGGQNAAVVVRRVEE